MKRIITIVSALLSASCVIAQLNITQLGKLSYSEELSDVWGYVDVSGNEYALVGVNDGFSVVDISNPSSPNEVFFISGPQSNWRDIKTWNNHAYVTTEGGGGLLIVDLSTLPGNPNLNTSLFTGTFVQFQSVHNLYIDENGICYLFGSDYQNGGAIMLDLTADPMNPAEVGVFDAFYLHDGIARGDTLWGSAINAPHMQSVIDVSDKFNPVVMAVWDTPLDFTHNCWVSDDNRYLFTTDEKSGAYIASYDVSDLNNVVELDRWQSSPGAGVIPHNTHFWNGYVITSYYSDGVNILDVSEPDNMVEIGFFDTSPNYNGSGYNGNWGVYPWLPSGNIIATDIEEGLYILGPTYVRACRLEGTVTDSSCAIALNNVKIEIVSSMYNDYTILDGSYKFGTPIPGTYDVRFTKVGYDTLVVSNVLFTAGQVTTLDVVLYSGSTIDYSGVIAGIASANLPGASVEISNTNNTYSFITDSNGEFDKCNVVSGTYSITIALWGYQTQCLQNQTIDNINDFLGVSLIPAYYDDFLSDMGWTVSGDAVAGIWTRGEPKGTSFSGTSSNPEDDVNNDCGDKAYVTGNGGGGVGNDDIDDGKTILSSPVFNLSNYSDPYLYYYSWFFNDGGQGGPPNDYFKVSISNGTDTVLLENITDSSPMSQWIAKSFKLSLYITLNSTMKAIFESADDSPGHLVEAAIDVFKVVDSIGTGISDHASKTMITAYPNPSSGSFYIYIHSNNQSLSEIEVLDILGERVEILTTIDSTEFELDLTSHPKGIYFVKVSNRQKVMQTLKLVKL